MIVMVVYILVVCMLMVSKRAFYMFVTILPLSFIHEDYCLGCIPEPHTPMHVHACCPFSMPIASPTIARPLRPDEDFSKLRVREIRELLEAHGVDCIGCVEKPDFIKKLQEVAALAK
ncbi:unnamed protein product [Choristocarpus tenellus]